MIIGAVIRKVSCKWFVLFIIPVAIASIIAPKQEPHRKKWLLF